MLILNADPQSSHPTSTRNSQSPFLKALPVFFSEAMVARIKSFSPSAGKPASVMQCWRHLGIPIEAIAPTTPVSREDLCLAHNAEYVDGVLSLRIANGFGIGREKLRGRFPIK
jgi:hypothetical protein